MGALILSKEIERPEEQISRVAYAANVYEHRTY